MRQTDLDAIEKAIAEGKPFTLPPGWTASASGPHKWMSALKQPPAEGQEVLLWACPCWRDDHSKRRRYVAEYSYGEFTGVEDQTGFIIDDDTCWTFLPSPPGSPIVLYEQKYPIKQPNIITTEEQIT